MTLTSRRTFLGAAAGALAAAGLPSLTGCAKDSGGSNAGGSGSGSGVINVWGGVPAANGPQKLIDAFQQANPKIKVNYTQFVNDAGGNLKLDTALQGGAPIDVFFTYAFENVAKRSASKQLLDLTGLVKGDSGLQKLASPEFTPAVDGKVFCLPTAAEPGVVFINKTMLEAAGIEVPTQWTVEEYHEIARKLSANKVRGSFASPKVAIPALGADAVYTADGKANFTNPAWLAEAKLTEAMAKDGSAFPEKQVISQQLQAYSQNVFLGGQAVLWTTAAFSLRYVNNAEQYPHDFITTFAPLPTPVGVKDAWNTGAYDNFISIAQKSKKQDAAWTFVRFWLGDGAKFLLPAGKVSPTSPDTTDQLVSGLLGAEPEKRYDVEAFKSVYFSPSIKMGVPKVFAGAAEIASAQTKVTQQLRLGQITAEQWTSTMQQQATAAIGKSGR
ncbi:extracellular solute-binding protein [Kribbella sp. NBC_00482]|uniref:ABC transporter substrate-binding protein n=1 Tax=Kribbella sp. NBC_00482 TaxID=2975968 RepID=UPI002E19A6CD